MTKSTAQLHELNEMETALAQSILDANPAKFARTRTAVEAAPVLQAIHAASQKYKEDQRKERRGRKTAKRKKSEITCGVAAQPRRT